MNNPWTHTLSQLSAPPENRPGAPQRRGVHAQRKAKHAPKGEVPAGRPQGKELGRKPLVPPVAADRTKPNPWGLTPACMDVMDLVAAGYPNYKAIAAKLCISTSTAYQRMATVREKMGVATNMQALLAYHRHYTAQLQSMPIHQPADVPEGCNKDDALVRRLALWMENNAHRRKAA